MERRLAELGSEENKLLKQELIEAKVRLHRKLIDDLNLSMIERLSREELRVQISEIVADYVRAERILLNARELENFTTEVLDELTGLGPIEPLLKDPTVSDILINTHEKVYVERFGQLETVPVRFKDEAHVLRIVNKIISAVGRRVDESQPMVDARLADGSRINVAVRPIAVDGPLVSIRKFAEQAYDLEGLVSVGSLTQKMADLLNAAVSARLTLLVSGGTGSGKTTLLNALSNAISHKERLISIEDAAELRLQQPHVGRLETRPPNIEGRGEIRQRELVKNALRMRPDRIIIGEVRGEEAFDMLQAMNTGHEGSMTTIHANNPRDALARMTQMVGMTGMNMTEGSIRTQIASAITLIVQLQRFSDGRRRIVSLTEIVGMERDVIQMQEIFKFIRAGTTKEGQVRGEFRATGLRPNFMQELQIRGYAFPPDFFEPGAS
ncbi:MAG: CpaF family protein [Rhodomicrobiaceae bacterium]